jgi:hypothetical protein
LPVLVRGIFQRVDHAFKKRKEENDLLSFTVADLETQLTHLEKKTQEQMDCTASLHLALSVAETAVDRTRGTCAEFESLDVHEFHSIMREYSVANETGKETHEGVHTLRNFHFLLVIANCAYSGSRSKRPFKGDGCVEGRWFCFTSRCNETANRL